MIHNSCNFELFWLYLTIYDIFSFEALVNVTDIVVLKQIFAGIIDTKTYVGYVDGILKCKFNCIDWSTSRFESAYIAYKRAPIEVTDDKVRPCEVKLFFKFWEFPILVFRFEESTHIVALETNSMTVVYYNMEPFDLILKGSTHKLRCPYGRGGFAKCLLCDFEFADSAKAENSIVLLGSIETCPKLIYSMAKHMEKITLYEDSICSPKEFLLELFALDKTGSILNRRTVDTKKIKTLLDKCRCIKTCKKGKFVVDHQEPSSMFTKITELENQFAGMPWYRRGLPSKVWQ